MSDITPCPDAGGVTLAEVITGCRNLAFDRYPTPCFYLEKAGYTMTVTNTALIISDSNGNPVTTLIFYTYNTLQALTNALLADPQKYSLSFGSAYIGSEPTNNLLLLNDIPMDGRTPVYRSFFFSDAYVTTKATLYFGMIMGIKGPKLATLDLDEEIQEFHVPRPQHMSMWMAYQCVNDRRVNEMAGYLMGETDFSGDAIGGREAQTMGNTSIRVNIGDVFALEESAEGRYNVGEQPWRVGSDNVLGDAQSFWYRLQLWLRKSLEDLFGDYGLRPDTIMVGKLNLQRDYDFYGYFDSHPYTISPFTRSILSRGNSNDLT